MIEQQRKQGSVEKSADFSQLISNLPSLTSEDEIERLRSKGYFINEYVFLRNLQPQRDMLKIVNKTILEESLSIFSNNFDVEVRKDILQSCQDSSFLILDLLLNPPEKIDVCSRNPKREYPRIAKMLMNYRIFHHSVPFVVPVCPDYFHYQLRDGIGSVGLKALRSIDLLTNYFHDRGFRTQFSIHVADVEGLDPAILEASGETTETHFYKTTETRRKLQEEVHQRGMHNVSVLSMNQEFISNDLNYLDYQEMYTDSIMSSDRKNIQRSIELLIAERNRLHNFEGMTQEMMRTMASRELAGYATYGDLIHGRAIILSPDAMSAIPAYHFGNSDIHQFTPVFYAK